MSELANDAKAVNRRGFLKGSALFAAALGLSTVLPASAQEPQPARPAPEPERKEEEPKPADKPPSGVLKDDQGREYRLCDICGGNMYKQGNTWSCEQCGFSYEE